MEMWSSFAPPSVLPDISPTGGEIDFHFSFRQSPRRERSVDGLMISPLVGEMSGRTEGGNVEHLRSPVETVE